MSFANVAKGAAVKAGKGLIKYQSEILLASGIVLTTATVAAAIKATNKSTKDIIVENNRRIHFNEHRMTKKEIVKKEIKNYILTIILLSSAIASQIGGYKAGVKRAAVLSAALKISEEMHKEYVKEIEERAEKLAPEELKTAIKEAEPKAKESAIETVIFSGDTEYCVRIDGYRLKKNIAQLKLDLETFRSKYYLSGYQDPVTVADLHDYIGVHVAPSDYDRRIDFSGEERWYTLEPSLENSQLFVDIDYTTRDIEKY